MALLKTPRTLRGVNAALCAALVLTVTSCVLMQQLGLLSDPIAFSHALHVEVGLECADCHEGTEPGEFAHADPVTCDMCHEDIDPDKPVELHAATIMAQAQEALEVRHPLTDEVVFRHAPHAEADVDCAACHGDVAAATTLSEINTGFRMDDCMSCHTERDAPLACATCHPNIDVDTEPPSHARVWLRRHGRVVHEDSDATEDRCEMCHTQSSCDECHRNEQPPSHTNLWRLRTHGVAASMDRESCYVCHQVDTCERCHEEALPLSHRASFGSPRNTHCYGCHEPLQDNACAVCHKGTPSHFAATPLPSDHNPGFNCRQCHGVDPAAPLPHVDDGSACIACHQ